MFSWPADSHRQGESRPGYQAAGLEAVDARGDAGGAEAVVDIDDGDVGSAGVEHAEESGNSTEAGAVADAGGDGDDGDGDKPANDAREGAFHARNADNHASLGELAAMVEEAVNAGDADVVDGFGVVSHHARAEQGFFGDGNVAGACGDDGDGAFPQNLIIALDGDYAGIGMKFGGFAEAFYGSEDFGVHSSDQDIVAGGLLEHGADDSGDLLGRFAFSEDDFGEALAERAVMIDFGEAQVFKGEMLEALDGGVAGQFPALDGLQNFQNILLIHSI